MYILVIHYCVVLKLGTTKNTYKNEMEFTN